jgi:hypothetical protein
MRPVKLIDAKRRAYAVTQVMAAPVGWIMTLREPTRTLDQNNRFWAMLTDLSVQRAGGFIATPEEWKLLVMHAAGYECQFMEGLDGRPFPIGFRSSRLSVKQMTLLMVWMSAYGDEQGITWTEPLEERGYHAE